MANSFLEDCIEVGMIQNWINKRDEFFRKKAIKRLAKRTKVDSKKIIFMGFMGNYSCNPRSICDELIKENVDCKISWGTFPGTRIGSLFFPSKVKTVSRKSVNIYKELASSKIIVDNGVSTYMTGYRKKKDQILIETWHGAIGIKKYGRKTNSDKEWIKIADLEGKATDYIISNSDIETKVYKEEFWPNTPVWHFGHPRNDIFWCSEEQKAKINKKIRSEFNIPIDAKLCMYAPTFRDDGDVSPYDIDYNRLTEALKTRFGGEWVILTRFHSKSRKYTKSLKTPKEVINVNDVPDIQDLALIIDCGITDYSSWICEYANTKKPGFTFATDVKNYANHERTLFWPLPEFPFPTSSDIDGLIKNILEFDQEKYNNDVDAFLKKHGSVDDGHASERVVQKIKELLGENK